MVSIAIIIITFLDEWKKNTQGFSSALHYYLNSADIFEYETRQ